MLRCYFMDRLLGIMIGSLAQKFEGAFHIKAISFSIFVFTALAFTCTFIFAYLCNLIIKRFSTYSCTIPICILGGIGIGVLLFPFFNDMPSFIDRLDKILSSASFILSYDENSKEFFKALGINKADNLEQILYMLNDKEWARVIDNTSDMSWYLQRISDSLMKTVCIPGTHLHLGYPVLMLGAAGFIPGLIIILTGLYFRKTHVFSAIIVVVFYVYILDRPLGCSVYFATYLIFLLSVCRIMEMVRKKEITQ